MFMLCLCYPDTAMKGKYVTHEVFLYHEKKLIHDFLVFRRVFDWQS